MNHNSFEVIQCPLNPLPIRALASTSKSNSKKNWSNPTPSYESVQKMIKDSKKKHGKSKNTTDNYNGNVCRGKEFIVVFVKDSLKKTEGSDTDGDDSMDPNLHQAFAGPPIECMPTALAMFIAQKCFTKECGKSTASAIHAAFLCYYDIM